jgi:hypothetical protein
MGRNTLRKALITLLLSCSIGLAWPGSICAKEDREAELEARVAALEDLVRKLALNHAPPLSDDAEFEERLKSVVEASVSSAVDEHQEVEQELKRKHSYQFGGYIKQDTLFSDFSDGSLPSGSSGRDFYIPGTIPVGGEGESHLDFHAKESRINFRSDHHLEGDTRAGTFLEVDFLLSADGDERVSNSYHARLRHAFVTYDDWLLGQTWTTLFNVNALPESLDFIGPSEATIFGRQSMIRYTQGPWQFALENPGTTVTPYGGGSRIVADDNHVPDFILRYNHQADWGTFTAAGIARELRCEDPLSGVRDSVTGYGISLSGKLKIGARDDFRWMASTGSGLGRYIGLNTANGAVLDETGNLEPIDSSGLFGSYRHFWNERWRSNLVLGYLAVDNEVALTGSAVTRNAASLHLNLIHTPIPRLDLGLELLYARRELESEADGDLTRLQFSAKYGY